MAVPKYLEGGLCIQGGLGIAFKIVKDITETMREA